MRYSFTIKPLNSAPFVRVSDDGTFEEAMLTAKMFQESFPEARVEINWHKK